MVSVITWLDAGLNDAVAAASEPAVGKARIGLDLIAVIAGFITRLPGAEIHPRHPVAAPRRLAGVGAGVVGDSVAVIAGFALVHAPVPADLAPTLGVAAVPDVGVTVIAGFMIAGARWAVSADHPVPADSALAAVGARVGRVTVAVIAGFALIDAPVAASLKSALGVAAIARVRVAVIAGFLTIKAHTIAADRVLARAGAGVCLDPVAIIAGLPFIDAPVPADHLLTARRAAIAVLDIAVVTLLKARLSRRQVDAHDPIAADRLGAGAGARVLLDRVTVVAGFDTLPDHPIAARGGRTGVQARVGLYEVSIIAALPRLHHAVAA